jgi:hypothetical protein
MATVNCIADCTEDPVVIKKILTYLEEKMPTWASLQLPDSRAPPQSSLFGWLWEAFLLNTCYCIAHTQKGIDWYGEGNWLGKGQMTGIHSGVDGPFGQDFSMIMQESSGSDCTMGMSFSGKGVNQSYTVDLQ